MKSSSTKADYVSAPPAEAGAPPSGVQAEIQAIDVAPLERLLEVKKEQARLAEYRTRADALKGKVEDTVWRRVVDDYNSRARSFDQQASPLKTQVRVEYQKLRKLFDRIHSAHESARLEKEELELRHAVGELSDAELAERLKAPNQALDQCRGDLDAVKKQRERFLEAFESEADLESTPSQTSRPPAPAAPEGASDETSMVPPEQVGQVGGTLDLKTVLVPEESAEAPVSTGQPAAGDEGATFLLPLAALIVSGPGSSATEHRLSALNYLGRSEDNQIQIARPGVSRKHALIVATATGFTIKDLQSQNGTYVNGDRITERALADGDCVLIGNAELTFRSPWPASGRP